MLKLGCNAARDGKHIQPFEKFLLFAKFLLLFRVISCRWVHIGCAVAVPEVFFVDVNLRDGVNIDKITSARRKLVSGALLFFPFRSL